MIQSEECTLQHIVNKNLSYNIPIYQRLYVWDHKNVRTLLDDLNAAYSDSQPNSYFIGSIVVVRNDEDRHRNKNMFDLLDGQQRFTTLWLLSAVLRHSMTEFALLPENGLRLNFSIRVGISDYFDKLISMTETTSPEFLQRFETSNDLDNISRAFIQILSYVNNEDNNIDKEKFADYILRNVQFILTEVPEKSDLTKLFEVINARGVQLKPEEVLKAQMLRHIKRSPDHSIFYPRLSALWDACADMNDYAARNLKRASVSTASWKEFLLNKVEVYDMSLDEMVTLPKFDDSFLDDFLSRPAGELEEITDGNEWDLLRILQMNQMTKAQDTDEDQDGGTNEFRSIIPFPLLLLHVLRIYLHRIDEAADIGVMNEKKLLQVFKDSFFEKFEKDLPKHVLDFFRLLWKVRVAFDEHIVKWVVQGSEKKLQLVRLYVRSGETPQLRPLSGNTGYTQLQAMLYHSQEMITQFWMTPYLNYLLAHPNSKDHFSYLKKLDNRMLSSQHPGKENLLARSKRMMLESAAAAKWSFKEADFVLANPDGTFFNGPGVRFPHYWFYKLEFVLWNELSDDADFFSVNREELELSTDYSVGIDKKLWQDYSLTSKNSVEHISPQSPVNEQQELCHDLLHHFGNLALVTRSVNSSYSNYAFEIKKAKFNVNRREGQLDALKLDLVYSSWDESTWGDSAAQNHQQDMLKILKHYYNRNV